MWLYCDDPLPEPNIFCYSQTYPPWQDFLILSDIFQPSIIGSFPPSISLLCFSLAKLCRLGLPRCEGPPRRCQGSGSQNCAIGAPLKVPRAFFRPTLFVALEHYVTSLLQGCAVALGSWILLLWRVTIRDDESQSYCHKVPWTSHDFGTVSATK